MQDILKLSETYSELRKKKNELKDQLASLEVRLRMTEDALIDLMTTAEMQNFKRADGTQFIIVNKTYPSAIPETKQELYEILRGHGYDDLFTINSQTLSSTLRQWREEAEYDDDKRQLMQIINPYIKVEERLSISMRKGKK